MDYLTYLLSIMIPLALLAQATDAMAGHGGRVGLGAVLFAAIGAYGYAILTTRMLVTPEYAVALVVAIILVLAALFGSLLIALGNTRYLLATTVLQLAFGEAVNNSDMTGGALGIGNIPVAFRSVSTWSPPQASLVLSIGTLIASTLFFNWLLHPTSRTGRLLHWVRDDPLSASVFAVRARLLLTGVFCAHAVIAALAGVSIAASQTYISPPSFGLWLSLQVFTVVFLGGTGSRPAAMVVGCLVVVALIEGARALPMRPDFVGSIQQICISLLLMVLLSVWRRGLFGPVIEGGPSAARSE